MEELSPEEAALRLGAEPPAQAAAPATAAIEPAAAAASSDDGDAAPAAAVVWYAMASLGLRSGPSLDSARLEGKIADGTVLVELERQTVGGKLRLRVALAPTQGEEEGAGGEELGWVSTVSSTGQVLLMEGDSAAAVLKASLGKAAADARADAARRGSQLKALAGDASSAMGRVDTSALRGAAVSGLGAAAASTRTGLSLFSRSAAAEAPGDQPPASASEPLPIWQQLTFEGPGPLGITLESRDGLMVCTDIKSGSLASLQPEIREGMVLMMVEELRTADLPFAEVMQLLKTRPRPLVMHVTTYAGALSGGEPAPSEPAAAAPSAEQLAAHTAQQSFGEIDIASGDKDLAEQFHRDGLVLLENKQYAEAVSTFDEVLRWSPDHAQGEQNLMKAKIGAGSIVASTVIQASYLEKKGEKFNTSYRKRWFVLTADGTVAYYKTEETDGKKPDGSIDLSAFVPSDSGGVLFELQPLVGTRTYVLRAESEEERIRWLNALRNLLSCGPLAREARADLAAVSESKSILQKGGSLGLPSFRGGGSFRRKSPAATADDISDMARASFSSLSRGSAIIGKAAAAATVATAAAASAATVATAAAATAAMDSMQKTEMVIAPETAAAVRDAVQWLQAEAASTFDSEQESHATMLRELWAAAGTGTDAPPLRTASTEESELPEGGGSSWTDIGFQNKDPAEDLRGGGVLSLRCLHWLAVSNPAHYKGLVGAVGGYQYALPLALASINISNKLMGDVLRCQELAVDGRHVEGSSVSALQARVLSPRGLGEGARAPGQEGFFLIFFATLLQFNLRWNTLQATWGDFDTLLSQTCADLKTYLQTLEDDCLSQEACEAWSIREQASAQSMRERITAVTGL